MAATSQFQWGLALHSTMHSILFVNYDVSGVSLIPQVAYPYHYHTYHIQLQHINFFLFEKPFRLFEEAEHPSSK